MREVIKENPCKDCAVKSSTVYNLNEEEQKLEKLINGKASNVEISILEDKIARIKESYAGKDPLSEFKKERLQREEELKNKNTALKDIITKLREENKDLKIKQS